MLRVKLSDWRAITNRLILFNIFISNLGTKVRNVLKKFVDCTMLGGLTTAEKDQIITQEKLNNLVE